MTFISARERYSYCITAGKLYSKSLVSAWRLAFNGNAFEPVHVYVALNSVWISVGFAWTISTTITTKVVVLWWSHHDTLNLNATDITIIS